MIFYLTCMCFLFYILIVKRIKYVTPINDVIFWMVWRANLAWINDWQITSTMQSFFMYKRVYYNHEFHVSEFVCLFVESMHKVYIFFGDDAWGNIYCPFTWHLRHAKQLSILTSYHERFKLLFSHSTKTTCKFELQSDMSSTREGYCGLPIRFCLANISIGHPTDINVNPSIDLLVMVELHWTNELTTNEVVWKDLLKLVLSSWKVNFFWSVSQFHQLVVSPFHYTPLGLLTLELSAIIILCGNLVYIVSRDTQLEEEFITFYPKRHYKVKAPSTPLPIQKWHYGAKAPTSTHTKGPQHK